MLPELKEKLTQQYNPTGLGLYQRETERLSQEIAKQILEKLDVDKILQEIPENLYLSSETKSFISKNKSRFRNFLIHYKEKKPVSEIRGENDLKEIDELNDLAEYIVKCEIYKSVKN